MKPSGVTFCLIVPVVLCLSILSQMPKSGAGYSVSYRPHSQFYVYESGSTDPLVPWKPRPVLGSVKTLVILVQFSDVKLASSVSKIKLNLDSISKWFVTSSYGKMQMDFFVSQDVVTLPRTMSYYGAPPSGHQVGDSTDRKTLYIENTLSLVWQRTKIDFKNYKNLVLIHAGGDEAVTQRPNEIWSSCHGVGPVSDEYGIIQVRARDGSLHSVWGISTFSESDPLSIWIHELSHSLGITDLYICDDEGYSEASGVGYWSIMDCGSWLDPPADIDGWNKYILGWIEPIIIGIPRGEYTLYTLDSNTNPRALLIQIGNSDSEYYFVHARRKAGTDISLPCEGVVVFRMNRMRERNYKGDELALIVDANPDTPKECPLLASSLLGSCESLDAPYNKGRTYLFRRGQVSVNIVMQNNVLWDDKARITFKAEQITEDSFKITLGRSPQDIGIETVRPLTIRRPWVTAETTRTAVTIHECVIASVAYGSGLAPEVQFLRIFRDNFIKSTFAGSNFMNSFDLFYYSFSPTAALLVATSPALTQIARFSLYPLLMALRASSIIFETLWLWPEAAVIVSGAFASAIIGLVYLFPFLAITEISGSVGRRRQLFTSGCKA